jgi:hypothetical protein
VSMFISETTKQKSWGEGSGPYPILVSEHF